MWRLRGEDGAPVNLSLNGTSASRSVQWHLKVQPWPFNCALITFMSWGRQQPQNNPSSFMNSPLGHCPSRPSPGILAAPSDPLLPIPTVCERSGPRSAMPRFFLLRHLAPFTRQPHWLKTGRPYPAGCLEVSVCRGGERSGFGGGQQPTRVRPHQLSMGIYKGSRHLSWPAGFGGSRLGFLPSQRLPAPEMLHCTHFLF